MDGNAGCGNSGDARPGGFCLNLSVTQTRPTFLERPRAAEKVAVFGLGFSGDRVHRAEFREFVLASPPDINKGFYS
jgi:hypothetical protein